MLYLKIMNMEKQTHYEVLTSFAVGAIWDTWAEAPPISTTAYGDSATADFFGPIIFFR